MQRYTEKRTFSKTPEPKVFRKKRSDGLLRFCVQKHAARHLHYDFRLECGGVLLSWAVPKGPSLNPKDKRLAIHVEDHPLDYQYFEGVIPKGSYGAGTVEIWDAGTFGVPGCIDRKETEKRLAEGMKQGHLAVILHGNRLKGEFFLQKLKKDPDDKAWLLIKKADSEASLKPVLIKSKDPMPQTLAPMLATRIDEPFDSDDWLFEVKWDGYRALAFIDKKGVRLQSRNGRSFNKKFPTLVNELSAITGKVILDGEIVALDETGRSHFEQLQHDSGKRLLCYYVFDILYKDETDLSALALIERKEILKNYLSQLNLAHVRYCDYVLRDGKKFFKACEKAQLEGVVGKKIASPYESRRSTDWVKIKTFTDPRAARKAVIKPVKPDMLFWPKENFTKGDLIAYYEGVAKFILPYLKNRPITLHRFPDGITKEGFYQKNIQNPPRGIHTVPIAHEGKLFHYLLIDSVKSLLYAIHLASIDLHPFLSRKSSLEKPDWCVIDLDPHGIAFDAVIEAALVVHELLESIQVAHYCKTSGGNGLHIVIPLHAKYSYDQSRQFAELICHLVHKKLPKTTSLERQTAKRPKKIYLDFMQNRYGQTIVAPYAVRPRAGALVSTPVSWQEVQAVDPAQFTLETVPARLEQIGDIFKPVLGAGIDLKAALRFID